MKQRNASMQPCPFTAEELARMTPSTRKLCEMVGKYPQARHLTPEEIALLRASKQEIGSHTHVALDLKSLSHHNE